MKTVVKFSCEICGVQYETSAEAQECEAQGVDEAVAQVGDIVLTKAGYGWFDGDVNWVRNPETRENLYGTNRAAFGPYKPTCPNGDENCFGSCCCFEFFYVVTAIDTIGHRLRYHVNTLAMTGKNGHSGGYTYNERHIRPRLVENPPEAVVRASKALIGTKMKGLL